MRPNARDSGGVDAGEKKPSRGTVRQHAARRLSTIGARASTVVRQTVFYVSRDTGSTRQMTGTNALMRGRADRVRRSRQSRLWVSFTLSTIGIALSTVFMSARQALAGWAAVATEAVGCACVAGAVTAGLWRNVNLPALPTLMASPLALVALVLVLGNFAQFALECSPGWWIPIAEDGSCGEHGMSREDGVPAPLFFLVVAKAAAILFLFSYDVQLCALRPLAMLAAAVAVGGELWRGVTTMLGRSSAADVAYVCVQGRPFVTDQGWSHTAATQQLIILLRAVSTLARDRDAFYCLILLQPAALTRYRHSRAVSPPGSRDPAHRTWLLLALALVSTTALYGTEIVVASVGDHHDALVALAYAEMGLCVALVAIAFRRMRLERFVLFRPYRNLNAAVMVTAATIIVVVQLAEVTGRSAAPHAVGFFLLTSLVVCIDTLSPTPPRWLRSLLPLSLSLLCVYHTYNTFDLEQSGAAIAGDNSLGGLLTRGSVLRNAYLSIAVMGLRSNVLAVTDASTAGALFSYSRKLRWVVFEEAAARETAQAWGTAGCLLRCVPCLARWDCLRHRRARILNTSPVHVLSPIHQVELVTTKAPTVAASKGGGGREGSRRTADVRSRRPAEGEGEEVDVEAPGPQEEVEEEEGNA